ENEHHCDSRSLVGHGPTWPLPKRFCRSRRAAWSQPQSPPTKETGKSLRAIARQGDEARPQARIAQRAATIPILLARCGQCGKAESVFQVFRAERAFRPVTIRDESNRRFRDAECHRHRMAGYLLARPVHSRIAVAV